MPQISSASLKRACLFSAIAGTIVTLITQFDALSAIATINWIELGFDFLVPFSVSLATASTYLRPSTSRHVATPNPQPTLVLEPRFAVPTSTAPPEPSYDISAATTAVTQIKDNAINVNQTSIERLSFMSGLIERCEAINVAAAKLSTDADDTDRAIASVHTTTQQVIGTVGNLRRDTASVAADVTSFVSIANDFAIQFTSVKDATATLKELGMKVRLLSLNASVEAARAGDAGRGFSVIAEEVRTLAEQSNADTAKIAEVIDILENTLDRLTAQVTTVEGRLGQTNTQAEESFRAAEKIEHEIQELENQLSNFSANMSAQLPQFSALTLDMNQIKSNTQAAVTGSADNIALCKDTLRSLSPMQTDYRKAS